MKKFWKKEEKREERAFDWRSVPSVDPEELDRWFGATDAKDRQFPLQLALQVHDELERELMGRGQPNERRMSEIRGGLLALRRFAEIYDGVVNGRRK